MSDVPDPGYIETRSGTDLVIIRRIDFKAVLAFSIPFSLNDWSLSVVAPVWDREHHMLIKLVVLLAGLSILAAIMAGILASASEWLDNYGLSDEFVEKLAPIDETTALICFLGAALFGFIRLTRKPQMPKYLKEQDIDQHQKS